MERQARIYVAGGRTLIGSALRRQLRQQGYMNVIGEPDGLALTDARQVEAFFTEARPEYVFFTGARSGGIGANQRYPAELILENLLAACHVISSAYRQRVKKLLYLASSCCYPRECPQPMRPEYLMTGPLERTNEAYATAKIAGIQLCQAYSQQYHAKFISAIPANVFGPGDDFNPADSHVIAALIRRMHEAKAARAPYVTLWGTGTPEREFIFVDDLADACLFLMEHYDDSEPINIGAGSQRFSINQLAHFIKEVTGYEGALRFDETKPDGMPRKLLDSSELEKLSWKPRTDFRTALSMTCDYFSQLEVETTHV